MRRTFYAWKIQHFTRQSKSQQVPRATSNTITFSAMLAIKAIYLKRFFVHSIFSCFLQEVKEHETLINFSTIFYMTRKPVDLIRDKMYVSLRWRVVLSACYRVVSARSNPSGPIRVEYETMWRVAVIASLVTKVPGKPKR